MSAGTLLFAGGGTGGHVFPMIAVADAVRALEPGLRLVFVGTEKGLETRLVPERGYELELVRVLPLRGGGVAGALRGVARAALSVPEGRALLKRHAPKAVFSIGGYAAGPISLAARMAGIPLALHEPNSVIGLANRLIAPFVQRAYVAFPEAGKHFSPSVVVRSGVPLRAGFAPVPYQRAAGALRVLVIGGSQGAQALNQNVPEALARSSTRVEVVHQAGRGRDDDVRALYAKLGGALSAEVVPFIDDVPAALAHADLVISRSGAGALAEICAVGRPSLLVPYPFAADDHQRLNAESLVAEGGAVSLAAEQADAARLAETIDSLAATPGRLETMAEAARLRGRPEAAREIALDLLRLAGIDRGDGAGRPAGSGGISVPGNRQKAAPRAEAP